MGFSTFVNQYNFIRIPIGVFGSSFFPSHSQGLNIRKVKIRGYLFRPEESKMVINPSFYNMNDEIIISPSLQNKSGKDQRNGQGKILQESGVRGRPLSIDQSYAQASERSDTPDGHQGDEQSFQRSIEIDFNGIRLLIPVGFRILVGVFDPTVTLFLRFAAHFSIRPLPISGEGLFADAKTPVSIRSDLRRNRQEFAL